MKRFSLLQKQFYLWGNLNCIFSSTTASDSQNILNREELWGEVETFVTCNSSWPARQTSIPGKSLKEVLLIYYLISTSNQKKKVGTACLHNYYEEAAHVPWVSGCFFFPCNFNSSVSLLCLCFPFIPDFRDFKGNNFHYLWSICLYPISSWYNWL